VDYKILVINGTFIDISVIS